MQNAYRIGGEVFGGEPMVIDPIRRIPAGGSNGPSLEQEQRRQQLENERLE